MKTKTRELTKRPTRQKTSPSKSVEDRGLNEDDQNRVTNASTDEDAEEENSSPRVPLDEDIEEEEERERKRRLEDSRGEEY
jgi:hypothetical protein